MSWGIYTTEWHHIINRNQDTKKEIDRLIDYIQQINHLENLESFDYRLIHLAVDGKEVEVKDGSIYMSGNTYVLSKDGLEQRHEEFIQWDESTDLIKLLSKAPEASEITMYLCYNAMVMLGKEYGYDYWAVDRSQEKGLLGNMEMRVIEYTDSDPEIGMVKYDENGLWNPDYSNSFDDIKDITRWFSNSTEISIECEGEEENEPLHQGIIEQLDRLSIIDDNFYYDDDWEEYGEISPNLTLSFTNKDISDIKDVFQNIYNLLKDIDSADFTFKIYAVPDGDNDYDFASILLELSDDEIIDRYCRF